MNDYSILNPIAPAWLETVLDILTDIAHMSSCLPGDGSFSHSSLLILLSFNRSSNLAEDIYRTTRWEITQTVLSVIKVVEEIMKSLSCKTL